LSANTKVLARLFNETYLYGAAITYHDHGSRWNSSDLVSLPAPIPTQQGFNYGTLLIIGAFVGSAATSLLCYVTLRYLKPFLTPRQSQNRAAFFSSSEYALIDGDSPLGHVNTVNNNLSTKDIGLRQRSTRRKSI
jgi:hypothetical protein